MDCYDRFRRNKVSHVWSFNDDVLNLVCDFLMLISDNDRIRIQLLYIYLTAHFQIERKYIIIGTYYIYQSMKLCLKIWHPCATLLPYLNLNLISYGIPTVAEKYWNSQACLLLTDFCVSLNIEPLRRKLLNYRFHRNLIVIISLKKQVTFRSVII